MAVQVRDAKIYVDILGEIVIGYQTKGTNMLLSLQEDKHIIGNKNVDCVSLTLTTDEWHIVQPRNPNALHKRRADIYIGLENVEDVIIMLEKIDKKYPNMKISDCPDFRQSFFPTNLEEGPTKLPQGFNCFRSSILDAKLKIKEINTVLQPPDGEFFIDYEKSDKSHWYQFSTPALHFAIRSPRWLKSKREIDYNKWKIYIDIKCIKAMLDCVQKIGMSS
ncbi:MAG: hypothetical protein ACFFDI_30140 [Promethearchaeota archaeon]